MSDKFDSLDYLKKSKQPELKKKTYANIEKFLYNYSRYTAFSKINKVILKKKITIAYLEYHF